MQVITVPVTQSQVEASFRLAGLSPADTVLVHASLSRLGYVVGGAETIVRALLACVGETGTLMAPAQTWLNLDPERGVHGLPEDAWPLLRRELPGFDPAVTPSRNMGAVAEMIRTWPGACRSTHPARSWTALGARAGELTGSHDLDDVHGERSPLGAAIRGGGKVLLIGVGYDKCTALHLAESRTETPLTPQLRERGWVRTPQGRQEVKYETIDFHDHDFPQIGAAFEAEGLARVVALGTGWVRSADLGELVDFAATWMRANRQPPSAQPAAHGR